MFEKMKQEIKEEIKKDLKAELKESINRDVFNMICDIFNDTRVSKPGYYHSFRGHYGILRDMGTEIRNFHTGVVNSTMAKSITENTTEHLKGEEFIDSIVDRIMKKQLPGGK